MGGTILRGGGFNCVQIRVLNLAPAGTKILKKVTTGWSGVIKAQTPHDIGE
ncbi:MAG: hypothetical protein ACKOEG_11670 [Chthoniobacterales bacterium]